MSSGQCAEGFGVCCISKYLRLLIESFPKIDLILWKVRLRCGGTSTTNITHLVLEPTLTPPTSSCDYTICPSVSNICRMKLEFTVHKIVLRVKNILMEFMNYWPNLSLFTQLQTFEIAQPFKLDVRDVGATQVSYGGAIGDCRSDSFSVSTKGSVGTPTICGFNTNQHGDLSLIFMNNCSRYVHSTNVPSCLVYVDVGDDCITASFSFGELTIPNGVQRQYDIQVVYIHHLCWLSIESLLFSSLIRFCNSSAAVKWQAHQDACNFLLLLPEVLLVSIFQRMRRRSPEPGLPKIIVNMKHFLKINAPWIITSFLSATHLSNQNYNICFRRAIG